MGDNPVRRPHPLTVDEQHWFTILLYRRGNVYEALTVPAAVKALRRKRNRAARKARRINRSH